MRTADPSAARSTASTGFSNRGAEATSLNRSLSPEQQKVSSARVTEAAGHAAVHVTAASSVRVPMPRPVILKLMRIVTASFLILLLAAANVFAQQQQPSPMVKFGIDVLRDGQFKMLDGKRVGVVANPASVDSNLISTVTLLAQAKNVNVVALYGPEHGIWGDEYAGQQIKDRPDPHTGLPVYSIYGKTRKPTTRMILPIETMVFDLQDIGSRSYTYISTLKMCMEACADFNIEMIVLDRPNPLGGQRIEGPMLERGYESFVGIPYVHGMTMGELAYFIHDLYYPNYSKLKIVKMQGWRREMIWSETGHGWVPTSPHIPKAETCAAYASTGILGELYSVNIGVGYTLPFELIGAPWIDADALASALPTQKGIVYRPAYFKPFYGAFKGEPCQGVQVHIDAKQAENLVETNYRVIALLGPQTLFQQAEVIFQKEEDAAAKKEKRKAVKVNRYKMFDKVSGSDGPRQWLLAGKPIDELFAKWKRDCEAFRVSRKKYLLY